MCLENLAQSTACVRNEFLSDHLKAMQRHIQDSHVRCTQQQTASAEPDASNRFRATLEAAAWQEQFLCAKELLSHPKLQRDNGGSVAEARKACKHLTRYESCASTGLRSQAGREDAELAGHMEYFFRALTRKHRSKCFVAWQTPAAKLGKRPQLLRAVISDFEANGTSETQECDVYNSTAEFFACGLRFTEIVSYNPPKEKICMAYLTFEACATAAQCRASLSEFNAHAMHVRSVVLSPYEPYCRGFVPPEVNENIDVITIVSREPYTGPPGPQPPPPVTVPPWTPEGPKRPTGPKEPTGPKRPTGRTGPTVPTKPTGPTVPPRCNQDMYLEKYFECGVKFVINVDSVMAEHKKNHECRVCSAVADHQACVSAIGKDTHCSDQEISIKKDLNYIDNELRSAPGVKCPRDKCHRKTEHETGMAFPPKLPPASTH
ncbi:uncharacterized protein LOC144109764 [Amblyomma americanum]